MRNPFTFLKGAHRHILLLLLCAFAIVPIYWMMISSLKPVAEIFSPDMLPRSPTFRNYAEAFQTVNLLRLSLNTLIIAGTETFFQLLTALLAAYALTRWAFKGRDLIFVLLNLTWLIPFQAIMIPNYVTIASLNLRNTILGVILPFAASSFAILSIYASFKSFPKALIEAAVLDKLSEPNILFRIVLPNIRAMTVSLGILLFINGWNEYIWAMLVNAKVDNAPIQIGLQYFTTIESNQWGPMMAAATLSSLPILVIYLVLQKQIINSFVRWGIK
jgi:ABC-type glycerol-3-phosphate transport system permease component